VLLARAQTVLGQMGEIVTSPYVAPFQRPVPIPPVLEPSWTEPWTDHYSISMKAAEVEILPGTLTRIWGYKGMYPGPTIEARRGREVVVHWSNKLPEIAVVHLHGGYSRAEFDGHPADFIVPGDTRRCRYLNRQRPATLWYHDHTMDLTGPHVFQGLAGFYLLRDDVEDALPLPKGANEMCLCIQDRRFNADGSLDYATGGMMMDTMFMGDTLLVNGAVQPYLSVGTRKMRFRILNGSNARVYRLALSNGQNFIQIGTDGGLLPKPVQRNSIRLAPGERVDVVIDFSAEAIGAHVVLQNTAGSGRTASIMRFDVTTQSQDESTVPAQLRAFSRIEPASAIASREFTLSMAMGGNWLINGQPFSLNRIDAHPLVGTTEIWSFRNLTGMAHPMHLHAVHFQVLDVNGAAPSGQAGYSGWKDTVVVPGFGTVRVVVRFAGSPGVFVQHCHILEHEDAGMMSQFEIAA
jgi:spore coat protein A